jgi:hypothetical protein
MIDVSMSCSRTSVIDTPMMMQGPYVQPDRLCVPSDQVLEGRVSCIVASIWRWSMETFIKSCDFDFMMSICFAENMSTLNRPRINFSKASASSAPVARCNVQQAARFTCAALPSEYAKPDVS